MKIQVSKRTCDSTSHTLDNWRDALMKFLKLKVVRKHQQKKANMNGRMWERGYIKERSWGLHTAQTQGMTTCVSETHPSPLHYQTSADIWNTNAAFRSQAKSQKQITCFHSITLEKYGRERTEVKNQIRSSRWYWFYRPFLLVFFLCERQPQHFSLFSCLFCLFPTFCCTSLFLFFFFCSDKAAEKWTGRHN